MKTIESMLRKEMCQLKKIAEEASRRLKSAPKGRLRIVKKRGGVEYYYNSQEANSTSKDVDNCTRKGVGRSVRSSNGRYMRKREVNLAKRIAQRDYDACVVKNAEERMKAIDIFLEKYKKTSLEGIYQKTNSYRRELILAPVISAEEFIKQWQAVEYKGKSFEDDSQEIITERGERVRSKSEKIIADKLYSLGIPYRYEYPLTLEGDIKIYPDFTILRMPEREEIYLEHFGMMDDSNYIDNVMCKLSTYERNGIYLGVKLFITYETSRKPLNIRALDELVRKLFCGE